MLYVHPFIKYTTDDVPCRNICDTIKQSKFEVNQIQISFSDWLQISFGKQPFNNNDNNSNNKYLYRPFANGYKAQQKL